MFACRKALFMDQMSRRGFTQQALGSLTFSLLETLLQRDAFAEAVKPLTVKWLADVNQIGNDLKDQKLKQLEWQKKVEDFPKSICRICCDWWTSTS